mgnify:FL=1
MDHLHTLYQQSFNSWRAFSENYQCCLSWRLILSAHIFVTPVIPIKLPLWAKMSPVDVRSTPQCFAGYFQLLLIIECALFCMLSNDHTANNSHGRKSFWKFEYVTTAVGKAKKWPAKWWYKKCWLDKLSCFMTLFAPIISHNLAFFVTFVQNQSMFLLPNKVRLAYPFTSKYSHMALSVLFSIHQPLHIITISTDRQKMQKLCSSTNCFIHTLIWLPTCMKIKFFSLGTYEMTGNFYLSTHFANTNNSINISWRKTHTMWVIMKVFYILQVHLHVRPTFRNKYQTEPEYLE